MLLWHPGLSWAAYLGLLEGLRDGTRVPEGLVHSDFLLAVAGGDIVGRVSIRFTLNEYLARAGGHIGYGVRPSMRRHGYATEILRQAVVLARSGGVGRLLIVCDDDNLASAGVIERGGGRLESVVAKDDGATSFRRYWID